MGKHEGIAIGLAALDFLHANDAVGAGLVVDNHGLPQQFGKPWSEDAGIDLIAAGRAGNDEPKPPVGPIASLAKAGALPKQVTLPEGRARRGVSGAWMSPPGPGGWRRRSLGLFCLEQVNAPAFR